MKVEIYKDKKSEFRVRFIAKNGEIIAISESYTTKQNAKKLIKLITKLVSKSMVVDLTTQTTKKLT
jgi:uncharacterized protein YegP (UPF0339 family)